MRYPVVYPNPPVFSKRVRKMLPGYPMTHNNPNHHYQDYGMGGTVKTVAGATVAVVGIGTLGSLGVGVLGALKP